MAVFLYAGYVYFFQNGGQSLETGESNEGEILNQEFLVRINELNKISFDRQLFDDPRFRSLTTFESPPEQVPFGRDNPFAE